MFKSLNSKAKELSLVNILSGIYLELKSVRKEQKRMSNIYTEFLMNQQELEQVQALNTQLTKVNAEYKDTISEKDRINGELRTQLDAIEANQADPEVVLAALNQARSLTGEMDALRADAAEVPVPPVTDENGNVVTE